MLLFLLCVVIRNSVVCGFGSRDLRLLANKNPVEFHGIWGKRERMEDIGKVYWGRCSNELEMSMTLREHTERKGIQALKGLEVVITGLSIGLKVSEQFCVMAKSTVQPKEWLMEIECKMNSVQLRKLKLVDIWLSLPNEL